MSLYRFRKGLPFRDYLAFSESVVVEYDGPIMINEVSAHLVAGVRAVDAPIWAKHVIRLSGQALSLAGSAPFAVVLVPIGDWVMAAAWGGGRHLLDDLVLDEGFGLLFGIRRLDPTKLRTVNSSLLDISARTTQTSFPSGSTVPGFRIDPAGELVTGVAGKADMSGLTYHEATGGKQYRIRAGDSLNIQVGHSPKTFLADLETICRVVEQSDANSPLRFIRQVRPLGDNDLRLSTLEDRLASALGGDDRHGPLGLCWPTAAAAHVDRANSFHTNNVGGFGPLDLDADLDIADLTERFARIPVFARVSELKQARLIPCADAHGEELMTRPVPMDRWVAFETTVEDRTYCLHQGRWYEIGQDAVQRVRTRVAELLENRSSLTFPLWSPSGASDDEHRYCQQAARQPGYLCLDRDLGHTPMHPRFEFADLLGPDDELVHVKWLTRATAASHLFTQARVSAWAQRLEPEALRQLDAKVRDLDPGRRVVERPRVVVLAVAGRRWDVDQLFTLSMVDLLRLNEDLHHHGVELRFADIPFAAKRKGGDRTGPANGRAA
ncbi:TIGR04141 family sporadically distributed protein [Actinosynnema sp. CA-299493]